MGPGLLSAARRPAGRLLNAAIEFRVQMAVTLWRQRLACLGSGSRVLPTVKIYGASAVHVGSRVVLNDFVHIWGAGGVHIGDNTMLASHVVVTSQSHDIAALSKGALYRDTHDDRPVVIGANVWVASGAFILPGVSIGDGAVVGAGAVVTRDVPPGALVMGVPARVVRQLG